METTPPRPFSHVALIIGLATAYFFAGKLSLDLALVHPQASAVWPPTGIALAALLLRGSRLWPGVLLGAFLVNVTTGEFGPARTLAAGGIAIGNTLEAVLGAYWVRPFVSGSGAFDRATRVYAFVAGVTASTIAGATCGIASLSLAGLADWDAVIWRHWWIGDLVGALIITPLLLLVAMDHSWRRGRGWLFEAGALLLVALVLPLAAFTRVLPPQPHMGLAFLCIPPLLWAAFRFGQREVAVTMLLISVIGIWGVLSHGLTAGEFPMERVLLEFQVFMGVISATFLAVAAEVTHRRQHERILEDQTEILRQQARVVDLAPLIVCDSRRRIIRWNSGAERLYGFAPSEAVGRISQELLQTRFPEPLEQIQAKLTREGSWQGELRHRTRAGQEIVVASLQLLHRDNQSGPATILEVHNDITELKRVEHERSQLARIVETSGDAIISKTFDGVITSWNAGAEKLYGYAAAEIIGRNISTLLQAGQNDVLPALLENLRKGETIEQHETTRRRKDGAVIDVSLTFSPLRNESGDLVGTSVIARDVTERKRAEQRFQQAVESAPSAMIMVTQEGRIVLANRQAENMFGYRREELMGKPVDLLVPGRFRDQHSEHRRGFFSEPRARPMGAGRDLYGLRKDGTEIPIEIGLNPIETEQGTWVLSAIVDITDRKRASQDLRESQERYELVVAGAEAAIWDWDVRHKRVFYSPRWKRLRGLSDDEVSDREEEWSSRIHPDDIDRVMEAVRHHLEGRTGVFAEEYRVRHKDGSWLWILDRGLAQRDATGRAVRMAGSETDITARKQTEEALRESEERFRTLADSSPVLIWINGLEGCEFVNRAYLDFLGVTAINVRKFDWAQFLHPDDQERVVNSYVAAFARREDYLVQHRFRRSDGEYRWMKTIGLPRLSPAGELLGYVGSTFDITDLKEAETALHEANRRKDEFLAVLGHELRNPLAAISMGMTLLQSDAAVERRTWIEEMVTRQVSQLQRLVEDLLDVSRITHGKIELRKQPVLLQKALEASIVTVEDVIKRHSCQLSLSTPDQDVYLDADPARVEQIIVNLLTNAAKYSPEGGQIWLSARIEGSEVIILCRDAGQGLSSEALEAIFDPFVQLPSTSDRAPTGLGIGLTLVKKLVEMHGGSIQASSAGLGKGSEFTLRFPASSQQALQSSTDAVQLTPAATKLSKVLVVDDNRDLAESLGLFLRGAGHEVSIAHDGETAISIAARERPDFVLLDIGLPGMDGFAVADRLRAMPASTCRIVAISGQMARDGTIRGSGLFDSYFVKPVLHEELLEFLRVRTAEANGA